MENHGSIANQMLALEAYEKALEIPTTVDRSLVTLATMNELTNFMEHSMLERTIDRIVQLKLHAITGLNVLEILDLPTYTLQILMRSVTRAGLQESKMLAAVEAKLKLEQQQLMQNK